MATVGGDVAENDWNDLGVGALTRLIRRETICDLLAPNSPNRRLWHPSSICHPSAICCHPSAKREDLLLSLSDPLLKSVISTKSARALASCAVEKPPHFVFAFAVASLRHNSSSFQLDRLDSEKSVTTEATSTNVPHPIPKSKPKVLRSKTLRTFDGDGGCVSPQANPRPNMLNSQGRESLQPIAVPRKINTEGIHVRPLKMGDNQAQKGRA